MSPFIGTGPYYLSAVAGVGTNNDSLVTALPAVNNAQTCDFSTTTTQREILVKPGVGAVTTAPTEGTPMDFGWNVLAVDMDADANTPALRRIPSGTWTFDTVLVPSAADATGAARVHVKIHKRSAAAALTLQASGYSAPTIFVAATESAHAISVAAVPEILLDTGETIQLEFHIDSRGIAILGQTVTFRIGNATLATDAQVNLPTPGLGYKYPRSRVAALILMSGDYKARVLADTPLIYWRLDETSGTVVADSSGNSRSGTYGGSPLLVQPGAVDTGTSVKFDNEADDVRRAYSAADNPTAMTAELWYKPGPILVEQKSLARAFPPSSPYHGWQIYQHPFGYIVVVWGAGGDAVGNSGSVIVEGQWYHIVFTHDGTTGKLYVNNVLMGSLATPFTANSDSPIILGSNSTNSHNLDGFIDEFALYNTALSAATIASHYAAASTAIIKRVIPTAKTGTLTLTSSVVRRVSKLFTTTLTLASSVIKSIIPTAFAATLTLTSSITKRVGKPFTTTITLTSNVIKRVGKPFTTTLTLTGLATRSISAFRSFSTNLSLSTVFARSVIAVRGFSTNLVLTARGDVRMPFTALNRIIGGGGAIIKKVFNIFDD